MKIDSNFGAVIHKKCDALFLPVYSETNGMGLCCQKCFLLLLPQSGFAELPKSAKVVYHNHTKLCKQKNQPKKQSSKLAYAVKGKRPSQSATSAKSRSKKSPSPRAKN